MRLAGRMLKVKRENLRDEDTLRHGALAKVQNLAKQPDLNGSDVRAIRGRV